jgi:hypothetical protein
MLNGSTGMSELKMKRLLELLTQTAIFLLPNAFMALYFGTV